MKREFLYDFISKHRYAVISTVDPDGNPEAALVGFAVAPDLKLIFDTIGSSRKYRNLKQNSSIALVIGWDNEQTVQYEGRVITQSGKEFNAMMDLYYKVFEDGRERYEKWKAVEYFVVVPDWIRYSDFNEPQVIEEMDFISGKFRSVIRP
jgi:uncharacterized pyridoxamine 5'-phosphate oxidase family protein